MQVQDSRIFSRLKSVFSLLSNIRGLSTKAEGQLMSFVYGRMQSCYLHTAFFYSIAKVRIVLKIYNGLELISLFSKMLIFLTRISRTISNGLNLSVSLSYKTPLSFILVHILYHIPHFNVAGNMSFLKKMMKYF